MQNKYSICEKRIFEVLDAGEWLKKEKLFENISVQVVVNCRRDRFIKMYKNNFDSRHLKRFFHE